MYKKIFLGLLLFTNILSNTLMPETLYILIHGTWANGCCWHNAKNDFFRNFEKILKTVNGRLICFYWPGSLSHQSRFKAGQDLADLIENQNYNKVSIVAHSHGGNVAIVASQILEKRCYKNKIMSIYALGCPIDADKYMPSMHVVDYFYNFYSLGDKVQKVFGFYDRKLPGHKRIKNIQVKINGRCPNHTDLHSAEIAYWIPLIHTKLAELKMGNFHNFDLEFEKDSEKNYCIEFFTMRCPNLSY